MPGRESCREGLGAARKWWESSQGLGADDWTPRRGPGGCRRVSWCRPAFTVLRQTAPHPEDECREQQSVQRVGGSEAGCPAPQAQAARSPERQTVPGPFVSHHAPSPEQVVHPTHRDTTEGGPSGQDHGRQEGETEQTNSPPRESPPADKDGNRVFPLS